MSTEKKLADALRMLLTWADPNCGDANGTIQKKMADYAQAVKALAEHDKAAAMGLPTDYRVTWEIDAFNATTPREAAEEARAAMTRAHTTATVFTVYGRDGSVTDVDLSEDEENDDE